MKNRSDCCLKCGFWGNLFHYFGCPADKGDICKSYITVHMRVYHCILPNNHDGKHIALEEAENDQQTPYKVEWCSGQITGKN